METKRLGRAIIVVLMLALCCGILSATPTCANVLTARGDNNRTGANTGETSLTNANVNVTTFGKLGTFLTGDGAGLYGQPLIYCGLAIGGGTHNVLYLANVNNNAYAFNADDPSAPPFWVKSLGPSVNRGDVNVLFGDFPVGTFSTMVIDPVRKTLFAVSYTWKLLQPTFQLHALDLTTGDEKANSPADIKGGITSQGVTINFDPAFNLQRPGLTLVGGQVFIGFGATYEAFLAPYGWYRGWLFGFDGLQMRRTVIRCMACSSTDSYGGGIWQGGGAFAADASNIYLLTGNGSISGNTGGSDWSQAVLKIATNGGLVGYFVPQNYAPLNGNDTDISAVGPMLIPGANRLVTEGKNGDIYVHNTTLLGQWNAWTDQIVQEFQSVDGVSFNTTGWLMYGGSTKAFWNSYLFQWANGESLKRWSFDGNKFNLTPARSNLTSVLFDREAAAALMVSSNGTTAGTGLVWAIILSPATSRTELVAFDATTLSELYDSEQNHARDGIVEGTHSRYNTHVVSNGKVYVPVNGGVVMYGLLP